MSTIGDDRKQGRVELRITTLHDPPGLMVDGDVDFKSLDEFTAAVTAAVAAQPGDIHLMLRGMTFIEVSGMRVLAETSRHLAATGRRLVLHDLPAQLQPVLDAVGWFDHAHEADRT